ncbi:hypothetical protein FO440_08495 [Mucilaginibacter corticis]|uniref:Yip1 domain-containing protein n=1 Tax=Mucilaginibacter corticis TaxID=2597670 RepID=A0A556MWA9_9SPHI|nr:hypothetical protein [Mucilaginibacter corticis]TSJ44197.1 hypothetical protein FO440_08495 [Mucilaginibacter corticis]
MERAYKVVLSNIVKKPLKAFGTIYAYNLYKYQYVFLAITGIAFMTKRQFYKLADTNNPFFFTFITNIGLGAIFGWMGIGVFSLLIYWAGIWLKGRATLHDIINIMAYATLISLVIFVAGMGCIIALRILGYAGANYPHVWGNPYYTIAKSFYYFSRLIMLFYLTLAVIGVSVAQGFTITKGALNVLLAVLIVIAPIVLITGLRGL